MDQEDEKPSLPKQINEVPEETTVAAQVAEAETSIQVDQEAIIEVQAEAVQPVAA